MSDFYKGKLENVFQSKEERNSFFSATPVTPEQMHLFDSIVPGDIVYCTMPLQEEKLEQIRAIHQKRPYVVLSKGEEYINAFYCSSKRYKHSERFLLSSKTYHLWKTGYVYTEKVFQLPISCLEKKLDTLTNDAMRQLQRGLLIQRANGNNVGCFDIDVPFRKGDLIRWEDSYYYVYDVEENRLSVYGVSKEQTFQTVEIHWQNRSYFVQLNAKTTLEQTSEYKLLFHYENAVTEKIQKWEVSQGNHQNINPSKHPELKYFFRFEVGQIFVDHKQHMAYMYLFSAGDKDYCAYYMYDSYLDMTVCNMRKIVHVEKTCRQKEVATEEEITNAIYDVIAYKPQYKWLVDALMSEEELI